MTQNPHYNDMKTAQMAYNDHTRRMHAKYGHLHSDDRLTVDEAMERMLVSKGYKEQSALFVAYRDGE